MKAKTRLFGEIDIEEEKIITLESGMIGFPQLQKFTLIFDNENEKDASSIMWLQSMDDGDIAFPVIYPNDIKPDYSPTVNNEMILPLGELTKENLYILTTMTIPTNIENMSINLKAPIIMNSDTKKGIQIIIEDDYPVKFKVYQILKDRKKGNGE